MKSGTFTQRLSVFENTSGHVNYAPLSPPLFCSLFFIPKDVVRTKLWILKQEKRILDMPFRIKIHFKFTSRLLFYFQLKLAYSYTGTAIMCCHWAPFALSVFTTVILGHRSDILTCHLRLSLSQWNPFSNNVINKLTYLKNTVWLEKRKNTEDLSDKCHYHRYF